MMDELVNSVAAKTGLSPEQARSAADAVIGFLKERLPAPAASALDSAIGGGSGEGGGLADSASNMLGGLGGMFGGNKE
jgi:hypothetical protein